MTKENLPASAPKPRRQNPAAAKDAAIPVIEVEALLGDMREAVLRHNGEAYRLRVTANNKLILTK